MTHLEQAFQLLDEGDLQTAEVLFRQILQSEPDNGPAVWGLARIANAAGQKDAAIKLYARCCQCLPGEPEPLIALGEALSERNRFDEAGTAFSEAVEAAPGHAPAHYALALHLMNSGDSERAEAHLRTTLEIRPSFAQAWEALGRLVSFDPQNTDLQRILALANDPDIDLNSQISLRHALAKANDDLGNHDEAFRQWTQANELQLSTCSYRVADMAAFFSNLKSSFCLEQSDVEEPPADQAPTPIFILGQPRSGSTLLEQLLLNHSQIASAGETGFLGSEIAALAGSLTGKAFPDSCVDLSREHKDQLAQTYLSFIARYAKGASHVIDKLPANFQSIGFIKQILPGAIIIHLNRSPAQTCFSIFRHHFTANEPFFCTLPEIVAYYRYYQDLMHHWRQVLPGFVIDTSYEELATNTVQTVGKLISHCGLSWEPSCGELASGPRHISTLSNVQARGTVRSAEGQRAALAYRNQINASCTDLEDEDWY